jgi:hypothetical protein
LFDSLCSHVHYMQVAITKATVFWDVISCILVEKYYEHFVRIVVRLEDGSWVLKMEIVNWFETLAPFYRTTKVGLFVIIIITLPVSAKSWY